MSRNIFYLSFILLILFNPLIIGAAINEDAEEEVVAVVNGEQITLEQLENEVGNKSRGIEQQLQGMKNSILSSLINNLLLAQEADSLGVSLEEYIKEHITNATVVTDAEVEKSYEKSKENLAGILPLEAKFGIRRALENNRRTEAFQKLFIELHKKADIENYFLFGSVTRQDIVIGDSPVIGASDAQVTIVEFSDFECPFSQLQQIRLKQLIENYPDKVRLVFKHFPLTRHKNAFMSSKAAFCAQQQSQFWDFHFSLFRKGQDLSLPALNQLAIDLGLDEDLFTGCMNNSKTEDRINEDIQTGLDVGVTGTPAFYINGKKIESPAGLEAAIGFELNQK